MNNFKRSGNSKESLDVGINHLINKIDIIRATYFNLSAGPKSSRHRTIHLDELENFNFLYDANDNLLSKMLKFVVYANTGRHKNIIIFFRDNKFRTLFDKQEIKILKKYINPYILKNKETNIVFKYKYY